MKSVERLMAGRLLTMGSPVTLTQKQLHSDLHSSLIWQRAKQSPNPQNQVHTDSHSCTIRHRATQSPNPQNQVHTDSHSRTIRHRAKQFPKPTKATALRLAFKHNLAERQIIPKPIQPSAR